MYENHCTAIHSNEKESPCLILFYFSIKYLTDIVFTMNLSILWNFMQGKNLHFCLPYTAGISDGFICMDDNATPHCAQVTNWYLEDNGIECIKWPGRSPDCNLIENLWDEIKNEAARKVKEHTSLQDLRCMLRRSWANLGQQRICTLVNIMHKRCIEVIRTTDLHIIKH